MLAEARALARERRKAITEGRDPALVLHPEANPGAFTGPGGLRVNKP